MAFAAVLVFVAEDLLTLVRTGVLVITLLIQCMRNYVPFSPDRKTGHPLVFPSKGRG
jgi:hypothetical protein